MFIITAIEQKSTEVVKMRSICLIPLLRHSIHVSTSRHLYDTRPIKPKHNNHNPTAMVSLWPFGVRPTPKPFYSASSANLKQQRDATSAQSFEKTLSTLQGKIAKASAQNELLRQRSRKLRVGWMLYGGFTYILAVLIFFLVTRWRNFGVLEYTVISGGPVLCVMTPSIYPFQHLC
jgi:hypothetical protein